MSGRAAAPAMTAFARGPFRAGGVVILEEDEARHLKVRRVAEDAMVRLVDGRGGVATARLALEQGVLSARVVATTVVPAGAATELLVGAGDRERFLSLVEKATELGATRIVPLATERALQVATRFQSVHIEKASRRVREALKQCGAAWAPVVVAPQPLGEAIRQAPANTVRLLADPDGGSMPPLAEGDAVQWVVGPEGGLTDAEQAAIRAGGFQPVALGRSTLRYDTAALAALALTAQARLGSLVHGSVQ